MELDKEYISYRNALYKVFKTEEGKVIKDFYIKNYIEASAFSRDSNAETNYLLGKKEMIQEILKDSEKSSNEIIEIYKQYQSAEE